MTGVLDVRVLAELAQDVGEQAARRFADQYRDALDRRLDRITRAIADRSAPAAYQAAISLATASAMVGATSLARSAWALGHDAVRHGTLPPAETLHELERLAHATAIALDCHRAGGDDPR
jgi:hypothetical protein